MGKRGLSYEQLYTLLTLEFQRAEACEEWKKARNNSRNLPPREALLQGMVDAPKESRWYSVLKALDPITPSIWNAMRPECRKQYMEELRSDHVNLSFGMAAGHANTLEKMFQDKQLEIRGGFRNVEPKDDKFVVTHTEKGGAVASHEFDVIVNCTGIGSDITKSNSPLINSLRERGWLTPHPDGGACVDFETGQLLNEHGKPVGQMFSLVGSLTYGTHLLTHCIWQVWQSSERTAQRIVRMLAERSPQQPELPDSGMRE